MSLPTGAGSAPCGAALYAADHVEVADRLQLTPPVPQKLRQPGVTHSGVSAVRPAPCSATLQ